MDDQQHRVVLVRISGQDSYSSKHQGRPFSRTTYLISITSFLYLLNELNRDGFISFSASGIAFTFEEKTIVITTATLLSPFITVNTSVSVILWVSINMLKENEDGTIYGTQIEVMFANSASWVKYEFFIRDQRLRLIYRASLEKIVPIHEIRVSLLKLLGGFDKWRIGWKVRNTKEKGYQRSISLFHQFAILSVPPSDQKLPPLRASPSTKIKVSTLH